MADGDTEDHSFEPKDGRRALDVRDTRALLEDGLEEETEAEAADFFAYLDTILKGELVSSRGEPYKEDQKGLIVLLLRRKYEEYRNGLKNDSRRDWEAKLDALETREGPIYRSMTQNAPSGKRILECWEQLLKKVIKLRISQCGSQEEAREMPSEGRQAAVVEQAGIGWRLEDLQTNEPAWTQEFIRWAVTQDFPDKKALFDSWLAYLREQGNMNALPVRSGTLVQERFPGMRQVTFVVRIGGKIEEVKVKIWVGLDNKSKKPTVFLEFI